MESYIYCRKCTNRFSREVQNISVNPHLLHWTYTWKNSKFTLDENKLLLSKVRKLKKIHNRDIKTRMLINSIIAALKAKITTAKK